MPTLEERLKEICKKFVDGKKVLSAMVITQSGEVLAWYYRRTLSEDDLAKVLRRSSVIYGVLMHDVPFGDFKSASVRYSGGSFHVVNIDYSHLIIFSTPAQIELDQVELNPVINELRDVLRERLKPYLEEEGQV